MEPIPSANPGRSLSCLVPGILGVLVALAVIVPLASALLEGQQPAAPDSADSFFRSGAARLSERKYKEAEEAFRKVIELEPSNSRGTIGLVEVYAAQNRDDEALQLLQAESEKNPARLDYRFAIGNVALHAAKYDLAIAEFQKVLDGVDKKSKGAGDLYFRMGEAYRRKGDLDFSIALYRQAQQLLPGNAVVSNTLAVVLDSAGQKKAAETEYRAILKLNPNNGTVVNNLAFLLADNGGDLGEALAYAHRARQLVPGAAAAADTLGWIYLKRNLNDEAVAIFREVVQKDPARPIYRYHLAMALHQKGNRSAAIEELNTALKSNPSSDDEQKIKELLKKIGALGNQD